ncbi:MAG: bifunctional folylpolyglutamate synthase/dihydrofolate synthase [Flexilinea sp.]|nr:bifunctional folylpolyglutamate synthase/dihydrofolate synthase [Flexilinea sp.]
MVKTIDEALDLIYSFVDYSMSHAKDVSNDVFTLDSIRSLTKKLNDPQNAYPVIHIAGTKGKGSVCAMLASALSNAGFRTGLYTSPHLIRFNERIMVDGKMISDEEIIDLTNRITSKIEPEDHISTFEFMTAMAFEYFKEKHVDFAVIETGLGGRLDATNIVDPALTIITSISMDHISFLGNTIEKIAGEKAGIIKPNVPVICGCQPYPEAVDVIRKTAAKKNSPWVSVSEKYHFLNRRNCDGPDSMMIWRVEEQKLMETFCRAEVSSEWKPVVIPLPLMGIHQMENAAAVYAALNKLKAGFPGLDLEKAIAGIGNAFWPCRFEVLDKSKTLVADGAHNLDSIQKLTSALDRYYGTKRIVCIFGASEDKALKPMINELAPHIDRFIMTRAPHPRAAVPEVLSKIAAGVGRENIIADTLEEAYSIYKNDQNADTCYIATGSLFVAGGIREIHMKNYDSIRFFG